MPERRVKRNERDWGILQAKINPVWSKIYASNWTLVEEGRSNLANVRPTFRPSTASENRRV